MNDPANAFSLRASADLIAALLRAAKEGSDGDQPASKADTARLLAAHLALYDYVFASQAEAVCPSGSEEKEAISKVRWEIHEQYIGVVKECLSELSFFRGADDEAK